MALAAGTALAYSIHCPRHPQCSGYVAVRTTHVISDRAGQLAEFLVQEGDAVGLTQPLVQLADTQLQDQISQKQEEISILQSELKRALASSELETDWRMRTLEAEICEMQLKSASYLKERYNFEMRRTVLADILEGDALVLNDSGIPFYQSLIPGKETEGLDRTASILELEAAANSAEVCAVQVELCDGQLKLLRELQKRLPDEIKRSFGVDVAEAKVQQAGRELEQLQKRESALTVASPAIGQVGVFQVKKGDHLEPGTPIVELLDASQRYLVVHVPSRQITNFHVDSRVRVIFPGNKLREGRVFSVAPQAVPNHAAPISVGEDAPIAVHVEQVGEVWPEVPMGSRVTVEVNE